MYMMLLPDSVKFEKESRKVAVRVLTRDFVDDRSSAGAFLASTNNRDY
jgi:hypothetical protein